MHIKIGKSCQLNSQTLTTLYLLTLLFFGPFDTTVSTGQPVVTSQAPTQVMTNPSVNATNPFVMNISTNQGADGCPNHHEWVWL